MGSPIFRRLYEKVNTNEDFYGSVRQPSYAISFDYWFWIVRHHRRDRGIK